MSQLERLKANLPATRGPGALGTDLIAEVLDAMDAEYVVEEGEVSGAWENGIFSFAMLEDTEGKAEVYQVHGTWERVLRANQFPSAVVFANDWNADHVWPKVYALIEDDDTVGLHAEVAVDFGATPTTDQVDQVTNLGIVAALSVFDAAEPEFPDARLVTAADVED